MGCGLDGVFVLEKIAADIIENAVRKTVEDEKWSECSLPSIGRRIRLEWPNKEEFGDLSTPIAMGLSKTVGKPPRLIAEKIIANLKGDLNSQNALSRVDVAGPGYINLTFTHEFLCKFLSATISRDFLTHKVAAPRKINLEFVSANPTGPLHVGHGRGAAFGDSLARILREVGHHVSTEYYINDAGNQMNMLGKISIFGISEDLRKMESGRKSSTIG